MSQKNEILTKVPIEETWFRPTASLLHFHDSTLAEAIVDAQCFFLILGNAFCVIVMETDEFFISYQQTYIIGKRKR